MIFVFVSSVFLSGRWEEFKLFVDRRLLDDYEFVILLSDRYSGGGYLYGLYLSYMDKWNFYDERERF